MRTKLTIQDDVAILTLHRSEKRNAFDMNMFKDIEKAQSKLRQDLNLRAIIIHGEGDDFSTGLDIKQIMQNKKNVLKLLWKWLPGQANLAQRVVYDWQKIPVPVICAIHGRCWGAGLQLALGADFRIVSPDSQFSIMESRWGLMPDMAGNLTLHGNLKLDYAMLLSMSGEIIDARQALEYGLVTKIENSPLEKAFALANQLKEKSPDSNAGIKRLYHQLWNSQRRKILAKETFYQWRILLGKNQRKSVKAMQSKQSANYSKRLRW